MFCFWWSGQFEASTAAILAIDRVIALRTEVQAAFAGIVESPTVTQAQGVEQLHADGLEFVFGASAVTNLIVEGRTSATH